MHINVQALKGETPLHARFWARVWEPLPECHFLICVRASEEGPLCLVWLLLKSLLSISPCTLCLQTQTTTSSLDCGSASSPTSMISSLPPHQVGQTSGKDFVSSGEVDLASSQHSSILKVDPTITKTKSVLSATAAKLVLGLSVLSTPLLALPPQWQDWGDDWAPCLIPL